MCICIFFLKKKTVLTIRVNTGHAIIACHDRRNLFQCNISKPESLQIPGFVAMYNSDDVLVVVGKEKGERKKLKAS